MEREYRYLLEILGAYITHRAPEARPEADWEKMVKLAGIHTVTGILGHMAKKYRLCPDPGISADLRQTAMATAVRYAQRAQQCAKLSRHLTDAGIRHILMKGAVVRDYYPVPELRTFGDVDLVIRTQDREASHRLMLELGYTPRVDWGPVYSYSGENELYEIHTDIMEVDVSDKADYRGYFSRMWEHTMPREDGSLEFTPEFHFLYQLTHIAKHIYGAGAGARMYLDLAVCILHWAERMDWDWLRREMESLELLDFGSVALTAVEDWFGVRCPMEKKCVCPELMDRFLAFTMEAGLYGTYDREQGVNALKKAGEAVPGSRLKLLLRRTFPPAQELKPRYTYLDRNSWLLPVAWVHRFFKTGDRLGKHAREARVILSADGQEVSRLQQLCRDIGL